MKSMLKGTVTRCIQSLEKHLKALHSPTRPQKQRNAPSKLTKDIATMHFICYGNADRNPNIANATKLISKLLDSDTNLLSILVQNIHFLEFEAKKQCADILNYTIRRASRNQSHAYIQQQTDQSGHNPIIMVLLNQFDQNMHSTLYEIVKRPELTNMLLNRIKIRRKNGEKHDAIHKNGISKLMHARERNDCDFVDELFVMAQNERFTVSSNAYLALYHLLIHGNKRHIAPYVCAHYETIFKRINALIQSPQFVIQKQFLLLLRHLLLNIGNRKVMMNYISSKENLAVIMSLMKKHQTSSISLDAFHVFKIFIVNPNKTKRVNITLWKNKKRLIEFLRGFHDDKAREDDQFKSDRSITINCVAE
eukprot:514263_1